MADLLPIPVFADIIQIIVFIVVIIFSILSQVLNKEKPPQPKSRPRKRPVANPQQRPQQQRPQQRPQQQQQPIETRLEDLIRRVSDPDETAKPGAGRERARYQPPAQRPAAQERLAQPAMDLPMDTPDQPFEGQALGDRLQNRQSKLARRIENRDEAMDSHMKDVFDHQIGSLQKADITEQNQEVKKSRVTTNEIADLLRSPDDIRKAIVMNQILNRPEDQW